MRAPIRFGVVGTNFISDWFCEAARQVEGVEVAAIYSRKEDSGIAFAKKHSVPSHYTSYDDMLNEVDAVYVASPNYVHEEQSLRAMKMGRHVLCEKIMAPDPAAVDRMITESKRCGVVLLEAMRPDFDPMTEKVRSLLPCIGKLRRAHFEYCQYSSRYDRFKNGEVLNAFDPKIANSALADIGVYPLHFAINLFGSPVGMDARAVLLSNGFEGMGEITLDYTDALVTVSYSKITDSVRPSVIEGELGSVTIDHMTSMGRVTFIPRHGESEVYENTGVANNMVYEISAFRDAVAGKRDLSRFLSITKETVELVKRAHTITGAVKFFDPAIIPHT